MRLLLLMSMITACVPPIRRPESSQLVVTGTVFAGGFSQRAQPLSDATVALRDANSGATLASGTSSAAGGYRLAATVTTNSRVVLAVDKQGFAPTVKALVAAPYVELAQSLTLQPLSTLECIDSRCSAPRVDVEWLQPPMNAGAEVATFELELENPLQVNFEGAPIALAYVKPSGGTTGSLALRIPAAAWSRIVDAAPGTGAIEVATATFDPLGAKWQVGPAALLYTESGVELPESALSALQRQEHAGGAVARLPVSDGRFIAVTGAPRPRGCITGVLLADDKPAQGGVLASTVSEPTGVDATGGFCIPTELGSDAQLVRTQYAGVPYAVLALPSPTQAGSCGGTCRDIGSVTIKSDSLRTPRLCRFNGRVIDTLGAAVPNAEVVAIDDSVLGNNVTAFCGDSGTRCAFAAPSKEDGTFTLNVPLLNSALVAARADLTTAAGDSQRTGGLRFTECPTEVVTVKLQRGVDRLDVTATLAGNVLTWTPPRAAARITATNDLGEEKWNDAPPEGLTPPYTVTTPLAAGDTLLVELDGVGRDGVQYVGVGSVTRP